MILGILGTGMIVKDMLRMIHKLELDKIYLLGTEQTREETEMLCSTYHLDRTYYDYDVLLASDVDTIYVALPNFLHYAFAKKALLAGKHVILEKPITANVKELKELVHIAGEKKRILVEAMNIHYLPAFLSLKERLPLVGQPKVVTFNYSQYSSRYDAFKHGQTLPVFDPAKAGGALMDLNVYNIHAIVDLFGAPKAVRYLANVERGIDTSGILTLDYGRFKVVSIGAKDCKAPVVSTIQGDAGCLRMDIPVNQLRSYCFNGNDGTVKEFEFEEEHRLYYEFVQFVQMIRELDFEEADRMMQISMTVAEIMEEARCQEGIRFQNDE